MRTRLAVAGGSKPATTITTNRPWISPLKPKIPPPSPSPTPSPPHLNHPTLTNLITTSPTPQRALDLFNRASSQPNFLHTNSTYAALLHRLARSRRFATISTFLTHMASQPIPFHPSILLSLMPHFAKASLFPQTVSLFHSIPQLTRSKPSVKALSTCLNLLVESGRFDLAETLLSDARRMYGLNPNVCVFNILVKHHCRNGEMEKAFGVVGEMREKGFPPNLITYSTLIGGLCREGRLKEAFEVFEEMVGRDGVVADVLAYNVLIDGFCRNGMADKARRVFGFMRSNGCVPNVVNYSALMNGYCREGRLEDARGVFEEMRDAKVQPDAVCYTTLVGCLCRMGRTDEGMELVREMGEKGCRPDVVTVNAVIGGLCGERRFSEAMVLLEKAPYEGLKVNKASYRIVMNCLLREGEVEKGVGLLGLMLGRSVYPHFAASNELLVKLCDGGKVVDAAMVLAGLLDTGFQPENDTWRWLAEVVSKERKLGRTFDLLDELTSLPT